MLTRKLYTEACDVWSCGVMLYILLVGYPPFYAATNQALFAQVPSRRVRVAAVVTNTRGASDQSWRVSVPRRRVVWVRG